MHEIIPGRLWISSIYEARDLRSVLDLGVEAVVDLAMQELPLAVTRELIYFRIPILDGDRNDARRLTMAIETITQLIRRQIPVLVACSAGMSRSPAIVAAVLSIMNDRQPAEVLQELAASMPHDVSPALWRDVSLAIQSLRTQSLE